MAEGDIVVVNEFLEDVGLSVHDLNGDTVKLGLITSATTPTASTTDPRWGAGGSTNWSTNEVTPGGNYASGGPDVTNTYAESAGTATFDATDVSILENASNPTNARWGILYNDTSAGKEVIAFVDLGGDIDLSAGDFSITWNGSGIFTLS